MLVSARVIIQGYPELISVLSQGSAQLLDNGNPFVGWGEPGRRSSIPTAA
jgi:hypothetical protein